MLRRAEAAAQVMDHLIDHAAHGYSQINRQGDGTTETLTLSSGERAQIHGGDYDCSEAARQCYAAIGVLPAGYWASYMWTGNEHEVLTSHGFKQISVQTAAKMQRGDVLWRSGHTELYLGNGLQGGARIDEDGDIKGRRKGDQTGDEIARSNYQPARWTRAYRYAGPERNEQEAGQPVNNRGLNYRGHSQSIGWLEPVRDGQQCGTTGLGLRLEALKITPPEGWELDVLVHIQDVGDKIFRGVKKGTSSGTGSSANDPIIGTTGQSKRLEGIQITPASKPDENLKIQYRVHVQDSGWTAWTDEGHYAGTRGKSRRIEAVQIKIV